MPPGRDLTEKEIEKIRELRDRGLEPRNIAERFGISPKTVSAYTRGKYAKNRRTDIDPGQST